MKNLFLLCFLLFSGYVSAQNLVEIKGKILSEKDEELEGVNIRLLNSDITSESQHDGTYLLKFPLKNPQVSISFSRTGFLNQIITINISNTFHIHRDIKLITDITQLNTVIVNSDKDKPGNLQNINKGLIESMPSVSGNFESVLKTLPGVSSNNELSSQYSVRGGNFDENLIYINDVEIFRPLLVRNGQQEGLSFINPELVSKASFSAGGFEARYGDKLSSVLDIRYSKPDSTQIIASAGILGLSATIKKPFKNGFYMAGVRTKTNQNILRTQPIAGSYRSQFYDFQALYHFDFSKKFSLSTFGDFNLSRFNLIPESRETVFGTVNQQFRLKIDYEGEEDDTYQSLAGAAVLTYKHNNQLWFKWLNSIFSNTERETFDIEGAYIFDEIETDYTGFENVRTNRGIGINYDYARNNLDASIYSSELRAYIQKNQLSWETGIRYQYDIIKDHLNEYQVIDSAGYTLPNSNGNFVLTDAVYAINTVKTSRLTAFIQNTIPLSPQLSISAGLRTNYNSFTKEFFMSPRLSAIYHPMESNRVWRFSVGSYNQPPFYRELRNFDGKLNNQSKSQRSVHLLAATDYTFKNKSTPLKFTSEVYFKKLYSLIPYKVENLRIRYFADQQSKGYAAGADFAINSEFVPGLESSFRLSLMKTAEDIEGDSYGVKDTEGKVSVVYPGYLKRSTDQRINFSAFFQDKLFNSPTYKVHLTLLYGSGLPVGPPQTERYADQFKIPAYRRVDIGFSKDFLEGGTKQKLKTLHRTFSSLIAYAEVFNLLDIQNTVSYLWIKDVNDNQFAIPNYLTSRQLNIKIIAKLKN